MDEQEENGLGNPMASHYQNPNLNAFIEEGLTIKEVKENSRLWLSLPRGLKKNAIHNIMKRYGRVINIQIPGSELAKKSSRIFAFVEYSTFKEAEKALREINNSKTDGLEIRAEFAHAKVDMTAHSAPEIDNVPKEVKNFDDSNEDIQQLSVHINLDMFKMNDPYEKVTDFHYKGPVSANLEEDEQKYIKSCAENALGDYDEEDECFEYNSELIEYNFLTFYCRACDNEALFTSNGDKRYFCSKECADSFYVQFCNEVQEEQTIYQPKQFDKVCLTAIINEKCVYIRPSNEDLNFILEQVYRKAKNSEPVEVLPEINEDVLVRLYDSFYRAKVLDVNDENEANISITVQLTDIGNTIPVRLDDVFQMTQDCKNIKKITAKIILKNVNVEAMNEEVTTYMMDLLTKNVELFIKEIDKDGVELKDNVTNDLVNEKIVNLANFVSVKFDDVNDLYPVNDLIPTEDYEPKLFVVNVKTAANVGGIVCVPEKYVKDFHELYRSLNVYGKMVQPQSYGIYGNRPMCLVNYNNQWHRAVVNAAKGDGMPECCLIDLQLMCKIRIKNIFQLPEALGKFPILSELYKIDGYDTNEEVKKYCNENISENSFIIAEKVEVVDGNPVIYIKMSKN